MAINPVTYYKIYSKCE